MKIVLPKGFISDEKFMEDYNNLGAEGMAKKYGVRKHNIYTYKHRYLKKVKLDKLKLNKRKSKFLLNTVNTTALNRSDNY